MMTYTRFCVALTAAVLAGLVIAFGLTSAGGRLLMKPVLAAALMTFVGIWFLIKERASRCNSTPEILAPAALSMTLGLMMFPGYLIYLYIVVLLEMDTGYSLFWSVLGIPGFALLSLIGVSLFLIKTRSV